MKQKKERVAIYVTEEQREEIKRAADAAGLSVSSYLKSSVLKKIKEDECDLASRSAAQRLQLRLNNADALCISDWADGGRIDKKNGAE